MSPESSIAHYRIISKLGEGGIGAVYRATDTKLNRDVAIKVIPEAFAADPGRMARFTREAQVLAALNHPYIAAIYGVEERAIVMELVEGVALAGPLPVEEAVPLFRQIAEAIETSGQPVVLLQDVAASVTSGNGQFAFARNGLFAYLAGSANSRYPFGWMEAGGKVEPLRGAPPNVYESLRLSPDGKRLVLVSPDALLVWDFAREAMTRLPATAVYHWFPVWTPDSRYVVSQSVGQERAVWW